MEARAMKNDLTCGVVRDLLPSYVEGLLGEESRQAVDRHLEGCPECTAQKNAMSAPPEAAVGEAVKEVDYLKRVKRADRKRVIISVIATAAGLLAALALKVFVIGTPLQPQSVVVTAAEAHEGKVLYLSLSSTGSGNAFHGWKVEAEDGVASIYARDVLASPLYSSGQKELMVSLENVREVWLGGPTGRLVWQDGMVISQECLDMLDVKTPYCGDAPALERIAQALNIREQLGSYTMELRTSKQPYRWTLEFAEQFSPTQHSMMVRNEYLMLALVDNLDEVYFTLPGLERIPYDSYSTGGSMAAEQANKGIQIWTERYNAVHGTEWAAKESVKDYTETPADFQRFLDILNWFYTEN